MEAVRKRLFGPPPPTRYEIIKRKLVKIDRRAVNIPVIPGLTNQAVEKRTITISVGEEHNEDTWTYIAIYLLAHCLNEDPLWGRPGVRRVDAYQTLVRTLVQNARRARVLNLENVSFDTSFHVERASAS